MLSDIDVNGIKIIGASKILDYLMLLANGRAKIDLMFATLIVLAVFSILLNATVGSLERTLLEGTDTWGDARRRLRE